MTNILDKGYNIAKILEDKGYKAYLVGGCVRDYILGRKINDVDITTDATPDQIQEVYKDYRQIDFGKKFGTIKILHDDEEFEITTFRIEDDYKDNRHPSSVKFSKEIDDDLKRRDFTINAMTLRNKKIYDPFNGRADIDKKLIRAVGDPEERIREDALRMLRAVRFSIQLDFDIEEGLKIAIKNNKDRLDDIARERIHDELNKMLIVDPYRTITILKYVELLDKVFPFPVMRFNELKLAPKDLYTIYGILFITNNENLVEKVLEALKYSHSDISNIESIVKSYKEDLPKYNIRKAILDIGLENTKRVIDIHYILNEDEKVKKTFEEILKDDIPKERKDIAINGHDLKRLGFNQGEELGYMLKTIEREILKEKIKNNKEEIEKFVIKKRRKI